MFFCIAKQKNKYIGFYSEDYRGILNTLKNRGLEFKEVSMNSNLTTSQFFALVEQINLEVQNRKLRVTSRERRPMQQTSLVLDMA